MISENQNDWKHQLKDLNSLPGENLWDKNASWEKLYERIGKKKKSNKTVWYWAAAACILFALMIPIVNFNKKTHQLAKVEIKQKPHEIKTSMSLAIDKKNSARDTNSILSGRKEAVVAGKFNNIENKMIPQQKINEIRLYDTVNLKNLVKETNENSLQPLDTSSYMAALISVKKKLKVVQINELGDQGESQPGVARNSDKHVFQFKFGNQEIFTNPSLASADNRFTILKIKTSTN